MNTAITSFKNKHVGGRVFLVGNGPSLNKMDLNLLKGETTIAMNRISMIYSKTEWRPTYYIFCSANCVDSRWGKDWSNSIIEACAVPETTPMIWKRYKAGIEKYSGKKIDESVLYLNTFSENPIGNKKSFSTDAVERLDKSGTSMNVALQLAYFMGFDTTYLIGCDSNWVKTDSKGNDPNHFDPKYKAHISDAKAEFKRMNDTHINAKRYFDESNKKVFNAGQISSITAYDKVIFEELFK